MRYTVSVRYAVRQLEQIHAASEALGVECPCVGCKLTRRIHENPKIDVDDLRAWLRRTIDEDLGGRHDWDKLEEGSEPSGQGDCQ